MRELTIREMRAELGRLGELLEREGQLVVTRRGEPIARILPINPRPRPNHVDLRAGLPYLDRPSEMIVRADRDAG